MTDFLDSLFKIAKIHAERLSQTIGQLKHKVPFLPETIENMPFNEILVLEMFVNRFSKLQDLMGAKIFKAVIEYAGESSDSMTLIDRLNLLHKLGIIENVADWKNVREMRKHLAHEYPDAPEIKAGYLNTAFAQAPFLILTLEKLEEFVNVLKIKNAQSEERGV